MPRPKRGDPEMLLVSFCDIVTIVTCSMFMAMIIVIDESTKIPVIAPVPQLRAITNAPVYFECRNNMLFPVDRQALQKTFEAKATEFQGGKGTLDDVERLAKFDAGNEYFRFEFGRAMMGVMGLEGRPGVKGIPVDDLRMASNSVFRKMMRKCDANAQFFVFFVREDSFDVFRAAREAVVKAKFRHGFEFLAKDEPITFEGTMANIGRQ